MITLKVRGQTCRTEAFLRKYSTLDVKDLDEYGVRGVNALADATPMDTGVTAASWDYQIVKEDNVERIIWTNSNIVDGVNIAAILQYGHATGNGGYVPGIDYINPALRKIFEEATDKYWDELARDSVEKFDTFLDTFADTLTDKLGNVAYTLQLVQLVPLPGISGFGMSMKGATKFGTTATPFKSMEELPNAPTWKELLKKGHKQGANNMFSSVPASKLAQQWAKTSNSITNKGKQLDVTLNEYNRSIKYAGKVAKRRAKNVIRRNRKYIVKKIKR